jgi:hypothetical protein
MERVERARRRRRRPWRWIGAAGLAVGASAWLAWAGAPSPRAPAPRVIASAPRPIAAPLREAAARKPPPRRAATHAARAAPPARDAGEVEICGFGEVRLPADDPYGLNRVPDSLRRSALDEVDERMLASGDEQVRAAALMIGAQARDGEAHSRIDRLARLAGHSQDPVVYAIAVEACRGWTPEQGGACQLLSRAQWVHLDPDNALPWLELAAEAEQAHEPDAEAEAMHRAASARRSDAHAAVLPALVERALVDAHAAPLQRTLALSASWSAQAAWAPPRSGQAYLYCMAEALADANRRQTCDALAQTLAQRGMSLADVSVGIAIGRNVGWPAERLQSLQQELDALGQAGRFQSAVGLDLSCEAVERMQDWMRRIAAQGEVQAAREALARSGHSVEQWSARYRKDFALAKATAEAAATASP